MSKEQRSMNGFVPRRADRKVGGVLGGQKEGTNQIASEDKDLSGKLPKDKKPAHIDKPALKGVGKIKRSEIDESLNGIDDDEQNDQKTRQSITRRLLRKKWTKRILIFLFVLIIAIGAFLAIRAWIASANIFGGSIFDIFQTVPLKQDKNGRTNILVVGTSEDDPGHQGATLTDSMMILSVDQTRKNAYMISIPRDLYVQYGRACNSGYEGKINEYYDCVRTENTVAASRKALTTESKFIGNIFGLEMHYGVNVNYTVMRELVNAVGGHITVTIESRHPDGQMDSNFDWKCGASPAERMQKCPPNGHFIDFPNGPVKLNAEKALYLAQARGDRAPTYGFEQSNFDREKNQQKIIKALREKAVSAGVLSDFNKVSAIIDALGKNLRTTFEFKEFRTLVALAQEIKSEDIQSISLIDGDQPIMTTGNVGAVSAVFPAAGHYEYGPLRALLKQKMSSDPIVREAAPVVVLNGSGVMGAAATEADKLKDANYTVAYTGDAPQGEYKAYTIYQIGSGNKGTAKKLESRYKVKITKGKPPIAIQGDAKFVVIIGPKSTSASGN